MNLTDCRHPLLRCAFMLAAISVCFPLQASTGFGIFDARTMAMGGASVASANTDNAQFNNSALLAFNDEIEERATDSRFLFPLIAPQISESAFTLEGIAQDDSAAVLLRAIAAFNDAEDAASAQAVIDASSSLSGEDIFADVYAGFAVSEPGRFQAAGFFMGVRLLAGGAANITPADVAALQAYREALLFVASNGAQGTAHPELFDGDGTLLDPVANFDSSVVARGAAITEIGVAMSRQIYLFGQPLAAGINFKALNIDTFEDVERVVADRLDADRNRAGYRHDLAGHRDGVASVGIGTLWKRLALDVAYAGSSDSRAAAIQAGYAF